MGLLNDKNFEQDIKTGISVVKFASLWNMDSRAFENQFRELSEELSDRAKFIVSDVNANQNLAKQHKISKIPTIMVFVEGVPVARITSATKRLVRETAEYFIKKHS